ncbi:MAG TPA: GNAT family N-acetyltransferase [Myxococcota bacterium]|nr:GNAT family N-acetyltransferase [Myxococcota bacterium]
MSREIRRLRHDEIEELVRLWRRSRDETQPWLEARMSYSPDDDLRFFRDVLAREHEVWVACAGPRLLGLLALRDAFVGYLYVDPPAQRSGVGRALLEHAKRLHPRGLSLYTHQRNQRARAFYERHGFRPVTFGVSPSPECEPDVRYAWDPAL